MKPPRRLSQLAPGEASPEELRASALFRAGQREAPALPPEALGRVEEGLRAATNGAGGLPGWVKAVVGAGLLGGGALAWAAASGYLSTLGAEGPRAPPGEELAVEVERMRVAVPAPADRPGARDAPLPEPDAREPWQAPRLDPLELPALPLPKLEPRAPQRPPAPVAAPAPGLPDAPAAPRPRPHPGDGALGREAASLSEAMRAMRDLRQPERALELLDAHDAAFPAGQLRAEAFRARLDALAAAGRRAEAIARLHEARRSWPEVGATASMRVLEGELLAQESRCREGLEAFEAVLRERAPAAIEERAWHGRARCRGVLGDSLGARDDARRYLELFPEGRFTGAMQQLAGD